MSHFKSRRNRGIRFWTGLLDGLGTVCLVLAGILFFVTPGRQVEAGGFVLLYLGLHLVIHVLLGKLEEESEPAE